MAFNQNSFANFSNNDIVGFINNINQGLNENLDIANTRQYRGGARLRNVKTLVSYLNQHNAQEIIDPDFNDNDFFEKLDQFIIHERNKREYEQNYQDSLADELIREDELNQTYTQYYNKQHELNKSYEHNYQNIANRETFYDDELDEENIQYFERQVEIENAIKRANDAVNEAIRLINKSKPILKKIDQKEIKDKSHLLEYYVPENEELYEYLDKFNHKFVSKNDDYLIVNEPYNLDEAIEVWKHYSKYDETKSDDETEPIEKSDNGSPIIIYYFNKISNLDDIYKYLQQVFDKELKPFKIHFQLSGVFESPVHDFENEQTKYEYEARDIIWKNYRESIPIIVNSIQDLDYVKMYIEGTLHSYETTSSSTKLTIVGSISFTISRMRKVTGHIKDLPIEFIKNDFIISDNEDDNLCFNRFLAICLSDVIVVNNVKIPKLSYTQKYDCAKRTKAAKRILLKEHNIEYTTKIPNKGLKVLNKFKGVTMEQMEKLARKHHLNINIYEFCSAKYSGSASEFTKANEQSYYDLTEQWFFNKNYPTHSALLYSNNQIIHIMYIRDSEKLTQIHICPKCHSYTHRGPQNMYRFENEC